MIKIRIIQKMFFIFIAGTLFMGGCSSDLFIQPSFISMLSSGDRHVSWAFTYFESWKRDRQPKYLHLAEEHLINAIDVFFELQSVTSPRITEFYVVRDRRVRSCRFLTELQFEAANFGYYFNSDVIDGCLL